MERKVKIISISGMPVSGKSTTIKGIKETFEKKGYDNENIHIVSVGNRFRDYFNKIVTFIRDMEKKDALQEFVEDEDIKRIFENPEYRKQISNIMATLKIMQYDAEKFDISNANNDPNLAGIRKIVDDIVDGDIERIGKEILDRNNPNEVWLVDSRLAFHNIPDSFAVRLTVEPRVAAKRLFNDKSRGEEDNKYKNIEEAEIAAKERTEGEAKRFKERYGIDLEDENNYNLIIDTSYAKAEDVVDTILTCEERDRQGKKYGKTWASPKQFLPLQRERDTLGMGTYCTIDDVIKSIKDFGYIPSESIEIDEYQGRKYIIEGHHRNFAAGYAGKTLIPYEITESDKSEDEKTRTRAEWRASGLLKANLLAHEYYLGKDFSYEEVYPGIYKELEEKNNGR